MKRPHYPLVLNTDPVDRRYWRGPTTTQNPQYLSGMIDWRATLLSLPKKPKLSLFPLSTWDSCHRLRCAFVDFRAWDRRACACLEPATHEAVISNRYSYPLCADHADYVRANLEAL